MNDMTRRERLMRTLRGDPVDRPAVSFYEIEGVARRPDRHVDDPFNIFTHPSWKPVFDLVLHRTDRIGMGHVATRWEEPSAWEECTETEVRIDENGSRCVTQTTTLPGGRVLTRRTRQDPDVDTVWTVEHPLRDADDLRAWLDLPERTLAGEADATVFLENEAAMGDSGIMMNDISDPICRLAGMFDFGAFTMVAMMEPALCRRALDRLAREVQWQTERIAEAIPGRLWRIVGPEYATPPYLPTHLFQEYVVPYDTPIVEAIQSRGGFARLHCHGRIREALPYIAATGCTGLDPIEPPPQGDVTLAWVKARLGEQMVLFGNLEASDLETLPVEQFERNIETALREGTEGGGRGFVLMPSASPYGRVLEARAARNYERMVEMAENWAG